ncbi:MAG TPA: hypothetical protein VF857_00505, partial [Spirochaetota bacterium]
NLILAAPDGKIIVREAESGKIRYTIDDERGEVKLVVYSPDGKSIAICQGKSLRLVRAKNGKTLFEFTSKINPSTIGQSAVFSSDGKKLYSGNFGLSAWNIDEEKELAPIGGSYAAFCNGIAFSPDRKHIALASDSAFRVIDMETGEILFGNQKFIFPSINLFTYSADGTRLFAGSDSVIQMFNGETGDLIYEIDKPGKVSCAAVRTDGKQIAYACEKTLTLCEPVPDGKSESIDMPDKIRTIAYSPDGKSVAVRDDTGLIRLLSSSTRRELFTVKYPSITYSAPLSFSSDGKFLSAGGSGEIGIVNLSLHKVMRTLKTGSQIINNLTFSPDGKTLVSCGDDSVIMLWDTVSWKEKKTLIGHTANVKVVSFSPDGKLLVSGGADKMFRFWDLPEGEYSGSVILSTASYTQSTVTSSNGKVEKTVRNSGIVKDFVVVTPSGLYDGTKEGLGRLHWVVGNEVIPLSEFAENFRTPGLLGQILSKHVAKAPIDATKRLFGKVRSVSGNEIVVSYSGTKTIAQVKERFTVFLDSGESAEIEATFPMMTSMKCRLVNAAQKGAIRPGMPVFR